MIQRLIFKNLYPIIFGLSLLISAKCHPWLTTYAKYNNSRTVLSEAWSVELGLLSGCTLTLQGSSKPKNREKRRSACPTTRPMVKRREDRKWSLGTGRRCCFLHQTWAMETAGLGANVLWGAQKPKWAQPVLEEKSTREEQHTSWVKKLFSLLQGKKKKKLERWSRLTDTDFHCGWFHTGSEFTLVQK